MEEVEPYLAAEMNRQKLFPGLCWRMWERKKTLLEKKYHILWKSPGDMNPGMWFE